MANRIGQVHKLGKQNRKQPDMNIRGKMRILFGMEFILWCLIDVAWKLF